MSIVRIIVLGNGAAGAEKQALALGQRLQRGLKAQGASCERGIELINVRLSSRCLKYLPPFLQLVGMCISRDMYFGCSIEKAHQEKKYDLLQDLSMNATRDPAVHVIIGCGRSTVALCAALRMQWFKSAKSIPIYNIQIQHPRVPLHLFNAVITPRHDQSIWNRLRNPSNVYFTMGTICDTVTTAQNTEYWIDRLKSYTKDKPIRVVWLIGGPCRGFAFNDWQATHMTQAIIHVVSHQNPDASLLVTFSRRTPTTVRLLIQKMLRKAIADENLFIWDGCGSNPYEVLLDVSTKIVITPDSISMTTEAIATGKTVFVTGLNFIKGKFLRFHNELLQRKLVSALKFDSFQRSDNTFHNGKVVDNELSELSSIIVHEIIKKGAVK